MKSLSVLLPAKNEAANIGPLLAELASTLGQGYYEVIVVDDASHDGTSQQALKAAESLGIHCTVVRLAKPTGQSTALHVAAQHAKGDWLVTLDADGQNDPADIPNLLAAAEKLSLSPGHNGHWLVMGNRIHRRDTRWKRLQSWVANRFRQFLLADDCPDSGCGLKVLPRHTFVALPYFNHMHRFMPALVKRAGGQMVNVPVKHRPRNHGKSNYNAVSRLWAGLIDIVGVLWLNYRNQTVQIETVTSQPHAKG